LQEINGLLRIIIRKLKGDHASSSTQADNNNNIIPTID